jgi:antagonist of KipI
MSTVHVLKPGLLTTVQDRGRWGLQAYGVSVAGPMDPCSHRVANAIVGNDPDAAALEVTFVGPELRFDDERVVAVAGAEFELTVDGDPVSCAWSFLVPRGATLRFGPRINGTRAYVGVAGGIDLPPTLGSRATHVVTGVGGLDGRPLRVGDRLPLGRPPSLVEQTRASARRVPRLGMLASAETSIRILPGPQADRFASDALAMLQSAPYTVGIASDRMGFRLEGPALAHSRGADIISDATPLGALQVPASGRPILLMADRQTTGGYPKIATVISADISRAGQLGPGSRLSFVVCSPGEAMAALIAQERALMALEGHGAS